MKKHKYSCHICNKMSSFAIEWQKEDSIRQSVGFYTRLSCSDLDHLLKVSRSAITLGIPERVYFLVHKHPQNEYKDCSELQRLISKAIVDYDNINITKLIDSKIRDIFLEEKGLQQGKFNFHYDTKN